LFVTNSVVFLPECDEILMLENGTIAEFGTYEDLMNKNGKFTTFINNSFLEDQLNKKTEEINSEPSIKKLDSIKQEIKEEEEKDEFKIIQSEKIEQNNVKLSNFIDYFKACSPKYIVSFLLAYIFMNIGKSLNQYYLSEWSNQEEKQRQSMLNISIPGGLPENPRNETDIEQRNFNLIIFVCTGLIQRKFL
jgi:hypothetical protein